MKVERRLKKMGKNKSARRREERRQIERERKWQGRGVRG